MSYFRPCQKLFPPFFVMLPEYQRKGKKETALSSSLSYSLGYMGSLLSFMWMWLGGGLVLAPKMRRDASKYKKFTDGKVTINFWYQKNLFISVRNISCSLFFRFTNLLRHIFDINREQPRTCKPQKYFLFESRKTNAKYRVLSPLGVISVLNKHKKQEMYNFEILKKRGWVTKLYEN